MRHGILIALLAMLMCLTAIAQTPPTLQISKSSGSASLSWSGVPSEFFFLQASTNLVRPITWSNLDFVAGSGTSVAAATPQQFFRLAQIVLVFQFTIFYGPDLEVSPGEMMTINGSVWCNGNIWTSPSASLTYGSTVTACGQIYYTRNPNDPQANGSKNNITFLDNTNNPTTNGAPLIVPLVGSADYSPTNMRAIINLPPAGWGPPNWGNAYSINGFAYDYNAVDLIISNSASAVNGTYGTNINVYYQNPNLSPNYLTLVPKVPIVTSTPIVNMYGQTTGYAYSTNFSYSFVTNVSFYDYREGKTVQAVQIDVGQLDNWLNDNSATGGNQFNALNDSSKGHIINSIFVYNNVPLTGSQLPAVRVSDGAQLPPGGFTVVTPQPMYVLGNYNVQTATSAANASASTQNTAYTYPAALVADAITILSSSWSDSYSALTSLSSRGVSGADTVNAAMVVGIVPSTTVNGVQHYSGGIENFFRLLENWNGQALWYNGSEVALFSSQYATNYWNSPGVYYSIPARYWGFDTNFIGYTKLPPLTPEVVNLVSP